MPLLESMPNRLVIINRTAKRAIDLISNINTDVEVAAGGFEYVQGQSFDIVINATSAGLSKTALADQNYTFAANSLAYDLVYDKKPTPFMQQASQAGASRTSDGLGMLVEQAAYSFKLWHGLMPDTEPVLNELKKLINI